MSSIVYVTVRSWEPWCYEVVTSPLAIGRLGVTSFGVTDRSFMWRLWAFLGVLLGLFDSFSPKRRLSVDNRLRRRSLLGALVLRACYVTARSWEPWCSEMFTLPLALGSLGVENCLRHRSLLGALVLPACHVTTSSCGVQRLVHCRSLLGALVFRDVYVAARSWEPWCRDLFASPLALESIDVTSWSRHRSLFGALV